MICGHRLAARLAIFIFLVMATSAIAKELHVPRGYASIQKAIDAAAPGDVVVIAEGTFTEQVKLKSDVSLRGAGAERTTIQCDASKGSCIEINGAQNVNVSGMTVRHTRLEGFEDTYPDYMAVIYAVDSTAAIMECTVTDGARCGILINGQECRVSIINCDVKSNDYTGIYYEGESKGRVDNTTCRENANNGLVVVEHNSVVEITGCRFITNKWSGISAEEHAVSRFADNLFQDNEMTNYTEIWHLVYAADIDTLETIGRKARRPEANYPEGGDILNEFYSGIKRVMNPSVPASVAAYFKMMEDWKAKYPNSAIPYVAEAAGRADLAWHYRGSGYANTVTREGWAKFEENLQLAEKALAAADRLGDPDPHIYAMWVTVGMGLSYNRSEFDQIIAKGASIDRDYYPLYTRRVYSLLPRWLGSYSDPEAFARRVAAMTSEKEGDSAYARLAAEVMSSESPEDIITYFGFQPERLNKSFDDILKLYPESEYYHNAAARLAIAAQDKVRARQMFELIGDDWDANVWDDEAEFDNSKAWAESGADAPPPVASAPNPTFQQTAPVSKRALVVVLGIGSGILLLFLGTVVFVVALAFRKSRER